MAAGREFEREISREVAQIQAESEIVLPTGRCRVCQHPDSRQKVNTLLSYGMGNAEIHRFCEEINEKRSKNNKITIDSIRNHRQRHFNIQAPTQAAFRRILEKRKSQLSDEFGDAVGNLLTGQAYLQVVAEKGWQDLVDDDTKVDYETGLKAMLQLESMQREGAIEEQVAQMRRDVGLLQQAVSDVASEHPGLMDKILSRVDELTGVNIKKTSEEEDDVVDVEVVDFYDQDDDTEATPTFSADEGDSLEE